MRRLATISVVGFGLFLSLLSALHFIQPELDPLARFGSEYAAGRMGWLMNVAFVCFAVGLAALALAFDQGLRAPARSRLGSVLLGLGALGILSSGVFNADLQGAATTTRGIAHDLSGFVAFLSLLPAMIIVSRRLSRAGRLTGIYRALPRLAVLAVLLFLAMLFLFDPLGLVGLGQRLFLAAVFAWLLIAAAGLRSGALATETAPEGSVDPRGGRGS